MAKCRNYDARAKKNASHGKPSNIVAGVEQKPLQYMNIFVLYMFDICHNISTKLNVVVQAYGDKIQSVICSMLEYVKDYLEHLISRLSHNNVGETDGTLSHGWVKQENLKGGAKCQLQQSGHGLLLKMGSLRKR
ncbi:hypothetical protein M513_12422 [Trichuris suis]|uniref:Uncharacterized protein n=1 Tax=Trichuris suis TaxID=68888 RepID=A0A085LP16_9BILA|nr:hypothetical protein M513_12422 [Trichuris suis]